MLDHEGRIIKPLVVSSRNPYDYGHIRGLYSLGRVMSRK